MPDLVTNDGNPLLEPLFEHLGVRLTAWRPDYAEFQLDLLPHHLNFAGRVHGGVVATLLDVAGGYCGLRAASDSGAGLATITLTISYHAPIAAGRLTARGNVTGGGRSVFFSSATLHGTDGVLIATAQGAYKRPPAPT